MIAISITVSPQHQSMQKSDANTTLTHKKQK